MPLYHRNAAAIAYALCALDASGRCPARSSTDALGWSGLRADVASRSNEAVWIDLYVPEEQAPGRYRDLKEMVFGFMNRDQRRQLLVVHVGTRPPTGPESLQQAQPPGEVVEVADLAPDHPALTYLRQRGFDPVELSSVWHVMYCIQAAPRTGSSSRSS